MIEIQEGDDVSTITRDEFASILAEAGRDYEVDIVRKGQSASGVVKIARRLDNGEVVLVQETCLTLIQSRHATLSVR